MGVTFQIWGLWFFLDEGRYLESWPGGSKCVSKIPQCGIPRPSLGAPREGTVPAATPSLPPGIRRAQGRASSQTRATPLTHDCRPSGDGDLLSLPLFDSNLVHRKLDLIKIKWWNVCVLSVWIEDDQPAPSGTGPDEGLPDHLGQQAVTREGLCYCKAELGSGCPGMGSKEGSGICILPFYLQSYTNTYASWLGP